MGVRAVPWPQMVADAAAPFHRMKAEGLLITRRFERWLLKRAGTVLRRRFSSQARPVGARLSTHRSNRRVINNPPAFIRWKDAAASATICGHGTALAPTSRPSERQSPLPAHIPSPYYGYEESSLRIRQRIHGWHLPSRG